MTYRKLATALTAASSIAAVSPLVAQGPGMADETVKLEKYEVTDVPIEQQILPTSRPFNSVYGTDRGILDTPRNVTIVSREQMNAIGILETRDFSKLTASSYTQTNFGLPSNPSIRGQTADVMVNGMRRGLTVNGNGMPINFNALESVNIVKGTANVLYGATSYAGGYADFITKKPFFDAFRGSVSATAGSFDVYRWTVDVGGPVSPKLAYRFSYSGEDSQGYYYDGKKKTQAVYGALEYRSGRYKLELNGEFFVADVTENWGINRVTQQLIDDGLYIPDAGSDAAYAASLQSIGGFANPVRPYGTPVKIDRRRRLLAPGDDSYGVNYTAQAIQTLTLSPDSKIVNNTFFNYVDRDTFSSYYYNSVHKDNYGIENRLQYDSVVEIAGMTHSYAAGFSARYQDVWAVDDFYHEPVNSFDLTRDPNLNRVPASAFGGFNGSVLIPGYGPRGALPGRYGTPGATYGFDPVSGGIYNTGGSSNDSQLTQIGPFYQHDVKFNERFSVLAGVRYDFLKVKNTDPLPPPGYAPFSDSINVELPSYNVSPVFKINDKTTVYYTFAYTMTAHAALGGGYAFSDLITSTNDPAAGTKLYDFQFEQDNYLHEVGLKTELLDKKLFLGAAIFDQEQSWGVPDPNVAGDRTSRDRYIKSKGFEIEANYQPNKSFYATASYSFFDSKQRYAGFLADSVTYDKRLGGSSAAPVTPDFPSITAEFTQPGIPEHLINFLVNYKFDFGLNVTLGAVITGKITTSQEGAGTALGSAIMLTANEIPWQHTVDLSFGYKWQQWDARLSVRNLTDQENWSAPNPGYGNGSINAELPINGELTLTYRF
jgi:outer membrane receptor protein involved in Fe transport